MFATYNKMADSLFNQIDICFRTYGVPSVISDSLKHNYTKLGIIGYEWMVQGFKEAAWSKNDFFFFLDDTESEDDILSRHLQVESLPQNRIGFGDLLHHCRSQEFGETEGQIVSIVTFHKQSKTIEIQVDHPDNVSISLASHPEKETEFIIKPWIEFGLGLLSRMTPTMQRFLNEDHVTLSTAELMYHAQPFMPVAVVYLIQTIDDTLHLVSLSSVDPNSKLMFVHPLTPNIVIPDGNIFLIATIVDDHYFLIPDKFNALYMKLLSLYHYSQKRHVN